MESILISVDPERIYKHILRTEGEKHPLYSLDRMEACADYILAEFESYGLNTNVHEFKVEGFGYTFRNIEASTNGEGPELLIVSHYDTVRHAPGANDNGSAVSVMLEAARVLSMSEPSGTVRFISFNLEELNPSRAQQMAELALEHGIRDENGRYTSWHTSQKMERFSLLHSKFIAESKTYAEAAAKAITEMGDELSSTERKYLEEIQTLLNGISLTNWPGKTSLMGSSTWVRDALQRGQSVKGVLCLETMGYTSNKKNSQHFPEGLDPSMFKIYGTESDLKTGDFLAIVGDCNSEILAKTLCEQFRRESVQLPYACLQEAFTYEQAAHIMYDILRSDHAPFWRENIPALMLTDTANFRYPFYHTPADTIDKLDFDFLAKICKAVVATALTL
ncbi:MAG: M28 family peptidase [Candidatus Thorarchaeota archaeon]|nr:M28 family peptidase [Candidatus Thorarchaeota archaeon]